MVVPHYTILSFIQVSVMVEDFNDNRPEFSETSYSVSVREDADIGDIVVIIRATDADSGINGVVSYSILGTVGKKLIISLIF